VHLCIGWKREAKKREDEGQSWCVMIGHCVECKCISAALVEKRGIRRRKRGGTSVHRCLQRSSYIKFKCICASLAERRKGMGVGQLTGSCEKGIRIKCT
jgi:hypothetical protein